MRFNTAAFSAMAASGTVLAVLFMLVEPSVRDNAGEPVILACPSAQPPYLTDRSGGSARTIEERHRPAARDLCERIRAIAN